MHSKVKETSFESINRGFNSTFELGKLSIGVVVPIENYAQSSVPSMQDHISRVKLIEELGFKALWIRDVPFHVPAFGDAGQAYDPFTYLGYLAAHTTSIALGIASIALPLHHPVHVAKSAATIDQLSNGRMILGVASGDRHDEYPAMGFPYQKRSELFRDAFEYIRKTQLDFPTLHTNHYGELNGHIDVLPKPSNQKLPMLVTGYSQQTLEWNAEHGDGWMYYPRNTSQQKETISLWRELIAEKQNYTKPFMQPLYIDLHRDVDFLPQPIHLGIRTGINYLASYFHQLKNIGVNHVALNLRFNSRPIEETLEQLADLLLPLFHTTNK